MEESRSPDLVQAVAARFVELAREELVHDGVHDRLPDDIQGVIDALGDHNQTMLNAAGDVSQDLYHLINDLMHHLGPATAAWTELMNTFFVVAGVLIRLEADLRGSAGMVALVASLRDSQDARVRKLAEQYDRGIITSWEFEQKLREVFG